MVCDRSTVVLSPLRPGARRDGRGTAPRRRRPPRGIGDLNNLANQHSDKINEAVDNAQEQHGDKLGEHGDTVNKGVDGAQEKFLSGDEGEQQA